MVAKGSSPFGRLARVPLPDRPCPTVLAGRAAAFPRHAAVEVEAAVFGLIRSGTRRCT
jgi:hypothetical protein